MLLDECVVPHLNKDQDTIMLDVVTVEIAGGYTVLSAAFFSPLDSVPN